MNANNVLKISSFTPNANKGMDKLIGRGAHVEILSDS